MGAQEMVGETAQRELVVAQNVQVASTEGLVEVRVASLREQGASSVSGQGAEEAFSSPSSPLLLPSPRSVGHPARSS